MKLKLRNRHSKKTPRGVISAMLAIKGCSERLKEELLGMFQFNNPAYLQAKRFSPWAQLSDKIAPYIHISFEDDDGRILIPRGIEVSDLTPRSQKEFNSIKWTDSTIEAPVAFPKLKVNLNDEQITLQKSFSRFERKGLRPFHNYLFISPTGTGKTIAQAAVASMTGQRVLILSLTDQIKRAWHNDLKTAFGIQYKDVGIIQREKWKIGKHFTIASVKTLARREHRWHELYEQIGTVILDETDVVSAPSLYEFMLSFPARYIIGATATARASNFWLTSIFGQPVKRIYNSQEDTETSMRLYHVFEVETKFKYDYTEGAIDFHHLSDCMIGDEDRNNLVVEKVLQDWNDGHSVLVATKRLPHVHLLADMLRDAGIDDVNILTGETNADKFYTEKLVKGIFKRNTRCIVATSEAIKRGANLNPLDRLHVVTPTNHIDLEQLIGRIRRKWKGKKDTGVTVYVDRKVDYLRNQFNREYVPTFRKLKVARYLNLFIA